MYIVNLIPYDDFPSIAFLSLLGTELDNSVTDNISLNYDGP